MQLHAIGSLRIIVHSVTACGTMNFSFSLSLTSGYSKRIAQFTPVELNLTSSPAGRIGDGNVCIENSNVVGFCVTAFIRFVIYGILNCRESFSGAMSFR